MVSVEFGMIPLLACFFGRYHRHQCTHTAFKQTAVWRFALVWAAWQAATLLWSLDTHTGVQEWGTIRFAIVVLLLWPSLDRRNWLIAGLAVGMFAANLSQVAHALGHALDIPEITFDRQPNRNSGWWQPVVGGSMLTAAVGLHLPAALTARGKWRVVGIIGLLASMAGVVATGSRGAWLATLALLGAGIIWCLRRLVRGGLSWGHLPLVVAVLIVLGAGGYRMLGTTVRARAMEGVDELQRIIDVGDYSTFTGARILMAYRGAEAFGSRPVWGIGAGSFKPWVAQRLVAEGKDTAVNPAHAHCHNTLLHVAATTGVIGLVLFGAVVVLSLKGGFAGTAGTGYEAGPAFALLGMVFVTPFDVVNVNEQTAAVWWILVTLCTWGRPGSGKRDAGEMAAPAAREG